MASFKPIKTIAALVTLAATVVAHAQTPWHYVAHMNYARQAPAAACSNGKIYVFGGLNDFSSTVLQNSETYDQYADSWTTNANSMPAPRYAETAVTLPNGHIMLLGGLDSIGTQQYDAIDYDPASDTYDTSDSMPLPGFLVAAAIGNDNNLWVLIADGGGTGQLYLRNLSDKSWTYKGTAPSDLGEDPVAVQGSDGLIYFMGGLAGLNETSVVYSYDAIHDVWTEQQDMNTSRFAFGGALGGDKQIYAFGAVGGLSGIFVGGSISASEVYDSVNQVWTNTQDLETARGLPGYASDPVSGIVYAIGGEFAAGDTKDQRVLDSVEAWTPQMLYSLGGGFTGSEGQSFSGNVGGFLDINPLQPASYFTATIVWEDGTQSAGTVSGGTNGEFTVSGSHTYAEGGNYPAYIVVQAANGDEVVVYSHGNIADAPLNSNFVTFSAAYGVPFSGQVATFSDSNPAGKLGDYTATVDWGDGSTSTGAITTDAVSGFDVAAGHTYLTAGSKTVKVTITDNGASTTIAQGTITVAEPPAVVSGNTITGVEGAPFSGTVGSFTDPDNTLTAGSFTATITWGDGSTSSGGITSNGVGGFNVSGGHTYADEGSYATGISVSVSGDSPGSSSGVANISDAPISATGYSLVAKLLKFSGQVASFTDANSRSTAADFSAHIAWGDGGNSAGTVSYSSGAYHVVGTHAYGKKGKYTVTVFIGDVGGSSTTATTQLNVGPVK